MSEFKSRISFSACVLDQLVLKGVTYCQLFFFSDFGIQVLEAFASWLRLRHGYALFLLLFYLHFDLERKLF